LRKGKKGVTPEVRGLRDGDEYEEMLTVVARSIAAELADQAVARRDYPYLMLRPIAPGFSTDFAPDEFVYYGTDAL
jgi:hypothetical protein